MSSHTLDQYDVKEELGRGASGVVRFAVHKETGRRVAIKTVRSIDAQEHGRAMREIKIRLEAGPELVPEHIATIQDEDGQRVHIVMEYIEGVRLDTDADAQLHKLKDLAKRWLRACEAVQSLHERGVVHRDLKPSNFCLTPEGSVWILDLGTARMESAANVETLTESGQLVGTVLYMSPEQARGERDITTATDIYALGVVGYQLLTQSWPHPNSHEPKAYLAHTVNSEPLSPPLRGDFARIMLRAVARNPKDRYDSAGAMARDIQAAIDGRPIEARRGEAWRQARRALVRHRMAIAALLVLALATLSIQQIRLADRQRELAAQQLQIAEMEVAKREAIEEEKRNLQLIVRGAISDIRENFEASRLADAVGSARLAAILTEGFSDEDTKRELTEELLQNRSILMQEIVRLAYPELDASAPSEIVTDLNRRTTEVGS
jgi:eukaryotic-like serine/threonine-protein kinase